jgi:hypothetical protein
MHGRKEREVAIIAQAGAVIIRQGREALCAS